MIGMLCVQTYWDIRYKAIPIVVTIVGGAIGLILSILQERDLSEIVYALVPGLVCVLFAKLTREAIGYGDGFLLCAMGMFVSCDVLLTIIMLAGTMAGMVALVLLAFKKKSGKDVLPLVPFLLVASLLSCVLEKGMFV